MTTIRREIERCEHAARVAYSDGRAELAAGNHALAEVLFEEAREALDAADELRDADTMLGLAWLPEQPSLFGPYNNMEF